MLNTIKRWLVKGEHSSDVAAPASGGRVGRRSEAQNDALNIGSVSTPAKASVRHSSELAAPTYVRNLLNSDTYRADTDKAPMQAWLATLPQIVRPVALSGIYPRITKKIMRLWGDDAALAAYMDDLTVDRRGGRIGFPPKVAAEISRLQDYIRQRSRQHSAE